MPNTITVELLGVARLLARVDSVVLPYPAGGTVGALLHELAARLPELRGAVFTHDDGVALEEGFVLSLDGRVWTRDLAASLEGAPRALLLSNIAGG